MTDKIWQTLNLATSVRSKRIEKHVFAQQLLLIAADASPEAAGLLIAPRLLGAFLSTLADLTSENNNNSSSGDNNNDDNVAEKQVAMIKLNKVKRSLNLNVCVMYLAQWKSKCATSTIVFL